MQKELYEMFPQWSKEKQEGYKMLGTDDLDSQATQSILNQVFGYKQNGYADRKGLYMIDPKQRLHIGVDLAVTGERKTYDNHVTMINKDSVVNSNSANVNAIYKITQDNYFEKCAFSTLLQVMSLLDVPLPTTDDGKKFLLSIDSSHFGHYDSRFKKVHTDWMEKLGFPDLIDIMNKYSKDDISSMRKGEYLTFRNGKLTYDTDKKEWAEKQLGFEIYLPKGEFIQVAEFKSERKESWQMEDVTKEKLTFSVAMVGKNKVSYSKWNKIYKQK